MRVWFIFAAMMGPKFFRRFVVLFALGMALMFYSLIRSECVPGLPFSKPQRLSP